MMEDKIRISGTDPLPSTQEEAVDQSIRHIRDSERHTIWFLSEEDIDYCRSHEEEGAFLLACDCDMILPEGEDQTDKDQARVENAEEFFTGYFQKLLDYLNETKRQVFVIGDSGESCEKIRTFLHDICPEVSISQGVYSDTEEAEKLVNELNAVIPDVVVISLPVSMQIHLLREYMPMMNAGLCICFSRLIGTLTDSEVPELIRRLHLTGIYHWIRGDRKIDSMARDNAIHTPVSMEEQE